MRSAHEHAGPSQSWGWCKGILLLSWVISCLTMFVLEHFFSFPAATVETTLWPLKLLSEATHRFLSESGQCEVQWQWSDYVATALGFEPSWEITTMKKKKKKLSQWSFISSVYIFFTTVILQPFTLRCKTLRQSIVYTINVNQLFLLQKKGPLCNTLSR